MENNANQSEKATKRMLMIMPLLEEGLDRHRLIQRQKEIAERHQVSYRTIGRYLESYRNDGFDGLKPKAVAKESFGIASDVLEMAIELRRECPTRSVADIIRILELEGRIAIGSVYRSSLQRHLQNMGFGAKQIRLYTKTGLAARRFQKEQRCQLWQGDVKYGPYLPIGKKGERKQVYLAAWIDDCTRYIVAAKFYANQKVEIIEDSLRDAVSQYGRPDSIYVDNGKIYRSKWLVGACAKLGIKLLHAKPYASESKGKIEAFNRRIDSFLSEAALSGAKTLEELNDQLNVWIEQYYHKNPHSGLSGISPETAFRSDHRSLRFLDVEHVRDAFLHRDTREVDKVGCINFNGQKYEVGMALIGRKVEVYSDPSWQDEVEIHHPDFDPFMAKTLTIGPYAGIRKEIPASLRPVKPASSRLLDALEKKDDDAKAPAMIATTFRNQMGGRDHV